MNAYKCIKRLENQLAQAADLVGLLQRRSKRAARTPAQQAAVDGDPLMRLLDRVVQTDPSLPDDGYQELAAAVEAQLQLERQQRARQRETRRRRPGGAGH